MRQADSKTTTRRAVLAGAATLPALAIACKASAGLEQHNPDAALIELVARANEAYARYWPANVEYDRTWDKWQKSIPARPSPLHWQTGGYDGGIRGIAIRREGGLDYCYVADPTALLEPQGYWMFVGPVKQWEQTKFQFPPAPGQESWWRVERKAAMEKRAREIFDADRVFQAEVDRLKKQFDVEGLEQKAEAFHEIYSALAWEIENVPAKTFAGLRAKAEFLKSVWGDEVPDGLGDDVCGVLESIIRDLLDAHKPNSPALTVDASGGHHKSAAVTA